MVIELGGSVFEITHDLVGDLFRAKNAGVTPTRGSTHGAATNQGLRGGPGEDGRDDGVLSSGVVAVGRMSRRSGAAWRYARTCAWCRAETRVLERGLGHNCLVNARLTDVKFRKK
jgi:hypothetical protein